MKKGLIIIIGLLALIAGVFTGYFFTDILPKLNNNVKTEEKKKEEVKKEPVVKTYKASLFAVGDALIHNGVYIDANTYKKDSNGYYIYDFHKMFTDIADIVKDYDLAFYNQETIIGGKNLGLSNYPCFNSPDEIGENLVDIGFNMVNLSTNHSKDKGITGLKYSSKFWEDQEDVYAVGSYTSKEKKEEARYKTINGINYALLGYSTVTNGFTISDSESYYWDLYDKEKVKNDIEKIKDKVDVIIVSMHWGTEYTHVPTAEEREIASYLSSLGVDIIIGHHPHVIQPIEYVGDTLVIYSLGNFISAQDGTMKRVGMMASLDINKTVTDGKTTSVTIDNVKGDLIWTYHQNYKNFKVIPFNKLDNTKLNGYQSIYDQYKKIINKTNDSRIQTGF